MNLIGRSATLNASDRVAEANQEAAEYSPFFSQKGQDEFVLNNVFDYENRGFKRNGFFVDLACADGVHLSNTYFMERYLQWKGILIEPNPTFTESIRASRTSPVSTKCVTAASGDKVHFRIDNGMLGGIVGDSFDNNQKTRGRELRTAEIIEVETDTLANILRENDAPQIVDYLSLDVEGAEFEVLRNFPFDAYSFRCLTVERPTLELDLLLDLHGYVQVMRLQHDTCYLHRDFLGEYNHSPRVVFRGTPAKNW